jgi:hypothetical protein
LRLKGKAGVHAPREVTTLFGAVRIKPIPVLSLY